MKEEKFDELIIEIEKELLALKTTKQTASPLVNFTFFYQDTTSISGKHYELTFGDGNQPIFVTFTSDVPSVIYVFRTPVGNKQKLDVYDLGGSNTANFALASSRPIVGIVAI